MKYTRGAEIIREVIVLRKTEKKRGGGKNPRKIKAGCSWFMTGWPTIHGIIMNKNRGEIIIAHRKNEVTSVTAQSYPYNKVYVYFLRMLITKQLKNIFLDFGRFIIPHERQYQWTKRGMKDRIFLGKNNGLRV